MVPADRDVGKPSRPFPPSLWLSSLYGWVAAANRRRKRRRAETLPVPVISLGNLTMGGTGKTPLVEWMVRRLEARGRRPAVLSRGYGAARGEEGRNDEFRVLEENVPGLIQVPDPSRCRGGRRAIELGADVLVLDDGFQHVQLERDLDIVLVDAVDPFGGGAPPPAGRLREPLETLGEADFFLITRADAVGEDDLGRLLTYLAWRHPGIPRGTVRFAPRGWRSLDDSPLLAPDALRGDGVLAFSGIGNPAGFRATLRGLGVEVRGWKVFRDHHRYTVEDLRELLAEADRLGGVRLVMTQKDAVKLRKLEVPARERWAILEIAAEIDTATGCLEASIEGALTGAT